ncbi:uncharacterized protein LOC143858310 [Tasmannia lanceolata]|uniref:uncharacterized protein LOC143858310 n=1 Tax=Tasmannia lanceolata TaxID=3420 RepID=UPI0040644B31
MRNLPKGFIHSSSELRGFLRASHPVLPSALYAMSSKLGGKAKPLKQPKAEKKEYDETDLANIQKKKDEEKALKEMRGKAAQKGSFGGAGLKKSGKK